MVAPSLRVFVPSKNRPSTKTVELWASAGITPLIFVEPQDAEAYKGLPIEVLPQNNQGLVYSRNYILNYARQNGVDWFCMCDDDIQNFGEVVAGKTKNRDASVILDVWEMAQKYDFALTGIAYRQYAWSEKKPVRINTKLPECCVITQTKKILHNYRQLDLKHDRDFAMQTIRARGNVAVFSRYCFQVPNIGSNDGGLHEIYQDDTKYVNACKKFVSLWPQYSRIVRRKGRFDIKVEPHKLAKATNQQTL